MGYDGKKWYVDSHMENITSYWKLWAYGLRPLIRVRWDPRAFTWQDPLDRSMKVQSFSNIQSNRVVAIC